MIGAGPVGAQEAESSTTTDGGFELSIFHHNDAESEMVSDSDFGGAGRFVALSWKLRAEARQAGRSSVMINAGDSFLASPEFASNPEWWLHDSIYQNMIKYDAMAIGNHEFDFGPEVLATFIKGFNANGDAPPFISANLDMSGEPSLQAYVDQGVIAKSTVVEKDGKQIGIVGATTDTLPFVSSPGDVVVNAIVPAVQAEIDSLTVAGVENIILLSHLQGLDNDIEVIGQLRGVDVAIGGGGDALQANEGDLILPDDVIDPELPYPLLVADADGNDIPLASGPGDLLYIGEVIVDFDGEGNVTEVGGAPHRVSGIAPDAVTPHPRVQRLVEAPVQTFVDGLATTIIGTTDVPLNGERDPGVRTQETGLGDLVADSLLWQANELAADFDAPKATVAIQNGGGIRNNDVIAAGNITELTTFDILPFANFVTVVEEVPADQFKQIMENAVSEVENAGGRFAQIAGFTITYDPAGTPQIIDIDSGAITTPGNRVVSVTLDDGTAIVENGSVVAGAPAVNIATIDFLARGGDQYPFGEATITLLATSYQQALSNYIKGPLDGRITGTDYPLDGSGRIIAAG